MRILPLGIPRLFVILSLALAGLMLLQGLLLKYAWDLKEQAFERGAHSALSATVLALESREIEGSAFEYVFGHADSVTTVAPVSVPRAVAPRLERFPTRRTRTLRKSVRRSDQHVVHAGGRDSLIIVMNPEPGLHTEMVTPPSQHQVALRQVVGEWINRAPQPITERLDKAEIAGMLQSELAKVGIKAVPHFGVVRPARRLFESAFASDREPADEVVLASDNITDAELLASTFRQQLFPLDPFASPYDLVLAFPEDKIYLFRQIWPLWLASILFITVIVVSFAKAWRTNAEQRRFADQLVDFINNMTHEFKTPISTVGLAGEAINRPDVREQPEVLERYVGMIRAENERMHRQVEKILQMARFERGDIELKQEIVDAHEMLTAVASVFALPIENRGGVLECALQAERWRVRGDRVHLESIFSNLVDNAVKYSPTAPQIKLGTTVDDGFLAVKITDQGLGISRENQRRVFEKYFRCPTGNRHDVKGYGLGLSFVQSLVKAHGGFVELQSIPGQGTTVTVSLPLLKDEA